MGLPHKTCKHERGLKANSSTTPRTDLFSKENKELPWVGFEPTTLQSRLLLPTELPGRLSRQGLKSTTQYKAKATSNHCAMAQYTLTQYVGADRGN